MCISLIIGAIKVLCWANNVIDLPVCTFFGSDPFVTVFKSLLHACKHAKIVAVYTYHCESAEKLWRRTSRMACKRNNYGFFFHVEKALCDLNVYLLIFSAIIPTHATKFHSHLSRYLDFCCWCRFLTPRLKMKMHMSVMALMETLVSSNAFPVSKKYNNYLKLPRYMQFKL